MRTSAIVCFVLAALATVSAFSNLSRATERSNTVGYVVGAFLPAVLLLIAGISLANKPKV